MNAGERLPVAEDVMHAVAALSHAASRSEFHVIRGVRYHVRCWGNPDAPLLFLLHGWMDMSATWQFVVDAMQREWNIVAPDWAGFGLSGWRPQDYFRAHYVADLDALTDLYSPAQPVRIVAHSMGGLIASLFVGVRPGRIERFINLDGATPVPPFGPGSEIRRLERWLDYVKTERTTRRFASSSEFAAELCSRNVRLTRERAEFLASQFTRPTLAGEVELLADPTQYKVPGPPVFTHEQVNEALSRLRSPMLGVCGDASPMEKGFQRVEGGDELYRQRIEAPPGGKLVVIPDAGHNVQHDQPERLARVIEDFMSGMPESSCA